MRHLLALFIVIPIFIIYLSLLDYLEKVNVAVEQCIGFGISAGIMGIIISHFNERKLIDFLIVFMTCLAICYLQFHFMQLFSFCSLILIFTLGILLYKNK